MLTKFGRYRQLHHLGFALGTLALGLFTRLNRSSKIAESVVYQMIAGLGAGMVLNNLLPAFQAALSEGDQASATASWAFIRSYGNIWGVVIPAAIFNTQVESFSHRLSNSTVRDLLSGVHAYEHATAAFVSSYHGDLQAEIIGIFSDALRLVWQVAIAFSGLASCLVFLEREIKLRKELDTEFGLKEKVNLPNINERGVELR